MNIELEEMNGVMVATLYGELDGRTAPQVQEKLLALPAPDGRALLDTVSYTHLTLPTSDLV